MVLWRCLLCFIAGCLVALVGSCTPAFATDQLPIVDGEFYVAAQEWAESPGPRSVRATIHFPQGLITNISGSTGLMLILHNWGGQGCEGAANPRTMADSFDVVAICVDYLQSGSEGMGPRAYDFGLLQAVDALRVLRHVFVSLNVARIKFHRGRIYAVGASGGGLVALMANKLAPRTFAGVLAMAPLVKLSEDIALGLPGNSPLNARWGALPPEHAEIRFVGNPGHLKAMRKLKTQAQVVLVHGVNDRIAPFEETQELHGLMELARLPVTPFWVTAQQLDGLVFSDDAHTLGHRTLISIAAGSTILRAVRKGKTDFERRDTSVRYTVTGGSWTVNHRGAASVSFTRKRSSRR